MYTLIFCEFYGPYNNKHHYFHFADKEIKEAGHFPKVIINKNPEENCVIFRFIGKKK